MPWRRNAQARKKTRRANTPKRQKRWRAIANRVLRETGDEARAVRTANGVLKRKSSRS
jgi:hypothetical protein